MTSSRKSQSYHTVQEKAWYTWAMAVKEQWAASINYNNCEHDQEQYKDIPFVQVWSASYTFFHRNYQGFLSIHWYLNKYSNRCQILNLKLLHQVLSGLNQRDFPNLWQLFMEPINPAVNHWWACTMTRHSFYQSRLKICWLCPLYDVLLWHLSISTGMM